jgi:cell division initiation protein
MPLTPEDVQNKRFRTVRGPFKEGYDEEEVDAFLDEVEAELRRLIADGESGGTAVAAPQAAPEAAVAAAPAEEPNETALRTLLLAQRTADEVKAAAHKEADLIKQEARLEAQRELSALGDRIDEHRREAQRHSDTAEKAKSELRSLLMSHLSLIERTPVGGNTQASASAVPAAPPPSATAPASSLSANADTDAIEQLPLNNGNPTHRIVE